MSIRMSVRPILLWPLRFVVVLLAGELPRGYIAPHASLDQLPRVTTEPAPGTPR